MGQKKVERSRQYTLALIRMQVNAECARIMKEQIIKEKSTDGQKQETKGNA